MSDRRPAAPNLRSRAEERLAKTPTAEVTDHADALRLLHELQVHQVELEMQNEELRDTRAALEGSLQRYTELFDFAPIGYVTIDAAGAIRELNFAAARLLGAPRGQVVGRRLVHFVAARDVPAFDRFVGDVLTLDADDGEPRTRTLELALVAASGLTFAKVTASLVDAPAPTALLAIEDVTARRRAEEALHEALRRRDDFLGTLSHELRNPLAPIRNGIYLLDRAAPGGEAAQRALAVIERQVGHLTRIVDDLLDVTRIARGKLHLQLRVQDLGDLVARTLDDHRGAFEDAGVSLDGRLDHHPCWAEVDATRLAQVVGNLLTNALKFTTRGGRVEVSLRPDGAAHLLSVRDTGAGIAPEVLGQLFEPFAQGPQSLARSAGGLGLGLATVKGLVELHGGTVGIASAGQGRGTEVTVRIPRASAPRSRAGAHAAPVGAHRRVLVIDDNDDAAASLRDVLETSGHDVLTAHDATAGLAAARAFRPEVVICDIGLPGIDGYAVARTLRDDPELRGAFLIALSGYARAEDVQRSRDAGFDRHVAKPPDIARLQALLAEAPHAGDAPAAPADSAR